MVKRQHQRTSSPSTSAQIRRPAVTTRSRRNQNTELFAFDMKRKRRSNIDTDTPEKDDRIDRRSSPSYSNSNIVDSIKLEDNESVLSPSKRAKLSAMVEYNNNQFDIGDNIQTNSEIRGVKLENTSTQNGVENREVQDNSQQNNIHLEPLRNGIEIRNIGIMNNIDNVDKIENTDEQEDCTFTEDTICDNIEMIIDNFKDVIEIRGTQMVIGNFVVEYNDYQKFLTLMNKLVDLLEMYDTDKILQSAKKIGCKKNTGQVLNPNLLRTKISKRAYKCLNEFQDDFTCTCNDAIDANPEKYDAGMNFLKFGARLFEQAYRELPSGIRQLCNHDDHFDATKGTFTKRQRKVALVQPTLDGHVFSSGAIRQPSGKNSFRLVGDLQEMAVVPSQSMDEEEIPTLGSMLPKNVNHEFELPILEQRKVSGVKFHNYKAYTSFAPIYDSSAAILSYEDTILARTYKKHLRISKRTYDLDDSDDSDLSEEEEGLSDEDMGVSDPEGTSQAESFEVTSSSKQYNIGNLDEETSQMEDLEINLSNRQINSNQMEDFEINSSNRQIDSNQVEDLEINSSNRQIDSSQMEDLEINSSNRQIDPSQMENLEINLSNRQIDSSQMENLEINSSNRQIDSSQMEDLEINLSNRQIDSNQMEDLEINSPNRQIDSSQMKDLEINLSYKQIDSSQMEDLEINLSYKQIDSSQMEEFEINLSNRQINSSQMKDLVEDLEINSSNRQINSSQMEILEINSPTNQTDLSQIPETNSLSKQNNSNQVEILEIDSTNRQNNFGEETGQMEILEITSSSNQNNSGEKISQIESLEIISLSNQNNSGEKINQMEILEITSPSKQDNPDEEVNRIEDLRTASPSKKNNSGEKINQMESFEIPPSIKQNDSVDGIFTESNTMGDEESFEDINVELLYKNIKSKEADVDKILDENVEIFKKVQFMQEKRLTKRNPNIISTKERELAIKLRNKLASIISEISPSDIVTFDSIEYAMDNLPIKEKFFKGMLPPDKSFAHPTNEVSRDAFGSGVEKSSEDMEAEYTRNDVNGSTTQTKSEEALPQASLAGPSPVASHSVPQTIPQQSGSQQSLHQSTHPISVSMTYPRAQVPMRMSYGTSQGMPTSYQMTYPRPVPPYYHPSQRYPTYGYYYPQYGGYPMSHSPWQQRSNYYR